MGNLNKYIKSQLTYLCPYEWLYKAPFLSFFLFVKIYFLNILIIAQTITDLFLTVWKLRPEWGKGAIGQDGQVTILDLPKAHGIPYMEVYILQTYNCILQAL